MPTTPDATGSATAVRRRGASGRVVRSLSARDPRAAQVWAAGALVTAMLATLVTQGLSSPDGTNASSVAVAVLVVALAALLLRAPAERVAPWAGAVPLLGVAVIVVLDLRSSDAGFTGQVFFVLPVIWAAAHLRAGGIVLVTAATTAGEALVVFSLLPAAEAATDAAYTVVLLVVIAAVLGRVVSQHERVVEQLRVLAGVDPLTGLVTRRVLDDAMGHLQAGTGARAALVVLDLDHFKVINDTHGHLGGDAALAHVAALLTASSREGDVVARMGGDELAVLMLDCSAEDAVRRARGLVEVVRRTPLRLPEGSVVPLSVSAGVASLTSPAPPAIDLYARADAALYAAKRAGRDRFVAAPVT